MCKIHIPQCPSASAASLKIFLFRQHNLYCKWESCVTTPKITQNKPQGKNSLHHAMQESFSSTQKVASWWHKNSKPRTTCVQASRGVVRGSNHTHIWYKAILPNVSMPLGSTMHYFEYQDPKIDPVALRQQYLPLRHLATSRWIVEIKLLIK